MKCDVVEEYSSYFDDATNSKILYVVAFCYF